MSKATFEVMTQPNGLSPKSFRYGDGFEVGSVYGRTFVGHGGGFPGVSTYLNISRDSPYTVVVLGNQDPPLGGYPGSVAVALVAEKARVGK